MLTPEQVALVQAWRQADAASRHWQAEERRLRELCAAQFFRPNHDGTHNVDFGGGYGLKLVTSSRVEVKPGPLLNQGVREIQSMPAYAGVITDLFKWTPSLVRKVYNDQPGAVKAALMPAITTTPNAPQLTFIDPAQAKK